VSTKQPWYTQEELVVMAVEKEDKGVVLELVDGLEVDLPGKELVDGL
jgi:hypothetical protein